MNSWKPRTATRVRPPFTVLAVICRANSHQASAETRTAPISNPIELKMSLYPVNCAIANGATITRMAAKL